MKELATRTKALRLLYTTILVLACIAELSGRGITNPSDNSSYDKDSNISSYGTTDTGVDVTVKIKTPSNSVASEKNLEIEETMTDWDWDFSAPSGGWSPVSSGWRIYLYDENNLDTPWDYHNFTVTEGA